MRRLALLPIAGLVLAACGSTSTATPAGSADTMTAEPSESAVVLPSASESPVLPSLEVTMEPASPSPSAAGASSSAATVSAECQAAFDTAAAAIAGNSSPADQPEAFTDTISTCTMDEWRTELSRLGGDSLAAQADAILQTVCAQPAIADQGLCTQIQ